MDVKVSNKVTRYQPEGPVEELKNSIFDLYPVLLEDGLGVSDVEILDGEAEESLDRGMFACIRQKGLDPTNPNEGIDWEGTITGEIPFTSVMSSLQEAVLDEGRGLQITFDTATDDRGRAYLTFTLGLTQTA
jgi:hypothetical protein